MATLGVVALSVGILSACSASVDTTAVPPSASSAAADPIPLPGSFASPSGTWATIAMGHLNDPLNTFWQLFSLSSSSSQWALATPPGVASNGGLVASVGPSGSLTAGFGPSLDLRFSPLAQSADQGATWAAGVLPGGLALVPDALATSSGHQDAALLSSGGGEVVASSGDLSSWQTIALTRTLATTSSLTGCGIESLTAVAVRANGDAMAGAACAHGNRAGVLVLEAGSWHAVGPSLPLPAPAPIRVVRLLATPTGATALISAGTGRSSELFAASSTDGLASWSVSAPLPTPDEHLVSTGVTPSGGLIAVIRHSDGSRTASVIDQVAGGWQALSPLPAGTAVVAAMPSGGFDALIVDRSTLEVDTLEASGWHQSQAVDVPIQYGSSG